VKFFRQMCAEDDTFPAKIFWSDEASLAESSVNNVFCLMQMGLGVLGLAKSSTKSRVSSVSIVSDYGLDDRAIGVQSPAEAKDFFSILCVQTGSGAHLASCTMGTGGPFPGGKARPGRDADHSPPSSAEVLNE
jgi:hypothetical protein